MSIKICLKQEIRRIVSPSTYQALENVVRSLFPGINSAGLKLTYLDEDNDEITVSSDLELKEGTAASK